VERGGKEANHTNGWIINIYVTDNTAQAEKRPFKDIETRDKRVTLSGKEQEKGGALTSSQQTRVTAED